MSEEDKWKALQKPFDPDEVELLPKYTGPKDANGRIPRDKYRHCDECGGFHRSRACTSGTSGMRA